MYDVSIFTISGELYHQATYEKSSRVGDLLERSADTMTLRRRLVYKGQVLPDHALLADVFPTGQVELQLMVQKRRLERLTKFPDTTSRALHITMFGLRGVGKSSLVSRYCHEEFHPRPAMLSVLPKEFDLQRVRTDDGTCLRLLFWDEAQYAYGHRTMKFNFGLRFRNKHALILVFDLTERQSFEELKKLEWLAAAQKHVLTTVLMGNKIDLHLNRQVSQEEAQSFAETQGLSYFEVSLKEGSQGIEELVNHLVFDVLAKLAAEETPPCPPGTPEAPALQPDHLGCQIL